MDYRRENTRIYVRLDRGDELLSSLIGLCEREDVPAAVFSGIGALSHVVLATYIDEKNEFEDHEKSGMLELLSLNGSITCENGEYMAHAHGVMSYLDGGEIRLTGGHIKSAAVLYTAEIVIEAVKDGIGRITDENTGISVWRLN